LYHGRL
jgi:hypothetical protein